MTKNRMLLSAVTVALLAATPATVSAAGFQVNEHSANGLGRALAGQAAMPENASVLAANPAAISAFDTATLSAQISYIDPQVDIRGDVSATIPGVGSMSLSADADDIAKEAVVPSAFYVAPLTEELTYGIGMFTTYGLTTDYADSYNGLHFADKAEVVSVTINPAVAYDVSDTLSVGFGVSAVYADAQIGTSTPQVIPALTGNTIPGNATIVKMQGDDWAFGWNAGVFWQATDATDLAFSYRAETELAMEGSINSDLVASYNQGGELALNFAAVTEFAVNHQINEQLSVQASAVFTEWSTFDKLEAELDDGSTLLLKEENFDDSWRLAFGATYQYNDELTLRAGYAQDEGAVSDEHRSMSIPDTDRQWFSAGFTYSLTANTSIDAAYVYVKGDEAPVNEVTQIGPIASELTAVQHGTARIFSVQINTSF